MVFEDDFYERFPSLLKARLRAREIEFPDGTEVAYFPFNAFRVVNRTEEDNSPVTREDFRSYAELGKKPRGMNTEQIGYYSVSCNTVKELLANQFKFPNPRKKIAKGMIIQEGGPCYRTVSTGHIDWWLYESTKEINGFSIIKELVKGEEE